MGCAYVNYKLIDEKILEVYKQCDIETFPLDIKLIFSHYHLACYPYSYKNQKFKEFCLKMSDDAFLWKNLVLYNDEVRSNRIRFSLAHELGHHVLKHTENKASNQEQEANYFASHILAPRMAIHYAKCKNYNDVSNLFGLTYEAADYAFQDYRRWHRHVVYHKMNDFDKAMYHHFYDIDKKCFVYNKKECSLCGRTLINSTFDCCAVHQNSLEPRIYYHPDSLEQSLLVAEKEWLYGQL